MEALGEHAVESFMLDVEKGNIINKLNNNILCISNIKSIIVIVTIFNSSMAISTDILTTPLSSQLVTILKITNYVS